MAGNDEDSSVEERVDRSVRRLLAKSGVLLILLAAITGWAYTGFPGVAYLGVYQLEPGQSAIIFRLGEYVRTEPRAGLRWHIPAPFESHEIVNVSEIMRQEFGIRGGDEASHVQAVHESGMQTGDNSIVDLGFVVQYRVSDGYAFESRYKVADLVPTLRDAAQAAVRQVVGTMTVDAVLTERRGEIELEGERILQDILDSYEMGIEIMAVELQQVQPPEAVRAAFDDVIAAAQDASLAINQARGYENEVLPRSRAQAVELTEAAIGYRDAKIAESRGEAERFNALVAEYQAAPEVTRKRLYLETMEAVLPDVEKIIIDPGAASILPYLPLGSGSRGAP
jgi:membrane protease subunit HflK